MYEFLKQVPIFSGLTDEDLATFCSLITELRIPAGEVLFTEGDLGDKAYVIKKGEIEIFKNSDGRNVLLAVRKPGEIIGEMSLLESSPRNASGRARTDSELFVLHHTQLDELITHRPSVARSMLHTVSARLKSMDLILQQSEKMAQLGMLTAGITHELNNPAAAARRGADQLQAAVEDFQRTLVNLTRFHFDENQQRHLEDISQAARVSANLASTIDPITRSDRVNEFEIWLEEREVEDAWELAPGLVDSDISLDLLNRLEQLANSIEPAAGQEGTTALTALVRWLTAAHTVHSLIAEINRGAGRISDIVKSLKSYSYLDQGPVQFIDIHEGLDNTLIMLRSALKNGVTIRRKYAENLPRLQAHGSELNQVWTNLLVNAMEAMDNQGEIILRTRSEPPWIVVEIEDNGPGIPQEIQSKIFSPFFTTKPVGKGTGLGLHISYNIVKKHGGDIRFSSKPGKTRFTITLLVDQDSAQSAIVPPRQS